MRRRVEGIRPSALNRSAGARTSAPGQAGARGAVLVRWGATAEGGGSGPACSSIVRSLRTGVAGPASVAADPSRQAQVGRRRRCCTFWSVGSSRCVWADLSRQLPSGPLSGGGGSGGCRWSWSGGLVVWRWRPRRTVTVPSGVMWSRHLPAVISVWCRRQRATRLSTVVAPPSWRAITWCRSHQAAGARQEGNRQPWSRACTARLTARGMVAVGSVVPSRVWPSTSRKLRSVSEVARSIPAGVRAGVGRRWPTAAVRPVPCGCGGR
jgi:hypothetical protein